jgi:ubiquitin-protein ligase
MTNIAVNRGLVFLGNDLSRDRIAVESEKLKRYYRQFAFKGSEGSVTAVEGYLKTADQNYYLVRVQIPPNYPYKMPSIKLPETTIEPDCPHTYPTSGNLCVMKPEQWTSSYSLAFMVSKTAIWVNKYDVWKRTKKWPGTEQAHQ